ncbi:MAG: MFS transporter [Bdellovibrionales bacterium]|nr:MFS transporter [Bdellovibrionales bacterium]
MSLYLTKVLGYEASEAGLFLGGFGAGAIVGSYAGGWLVSRLNSTLVQAVALVVQGLGFYVLSCLSGAAALAACLFVIGVFAEGFRPANATALADACEAGERARAFALNRLAINIGMTIGPATGGWLAETSYDILFYVDGLTCFAAAVFLFFGVPATPPIPTSEVQTSVSVWRDKYFLAFLALMLLFEVVLMQVFSTLPLELKQGYALSEGAIGMVYSVNTVLIIVAEMLVVKRVEHFRPLLVMANGGLLAGVALGLLPWGASFEVAVAIMVVFTIGEMLIAPVSGAFVANRASTQERGSYMGLFSASFAFANVVAPMAGLALYQQNPRLLWGTCVVLSVLGWVGFALLNRLQDGRVRA